uniref:Integrase catalytic domain-containing protein n=1 Tax=Cannabis sativa TaxID=3483 RepID=A0A803QS52_CANSA
KHFVDVKTRYPEIEKLAYDLIVALRKLKPYFHAHAIVVLTNHPLRQVMHKPKTLGRLLKWSIELSQFDISYTLRVSINGQVMADFIVEFIYHPEWETKGKRESNANADALSKLASTQEIDALESVLGLASRKGRSKVRIAIDYYTKWVEAKALVSITAKQVVSFINEFLICRFVVPYKIITDNGTQFEGDLLSSYCTERGVEMGFLVVVHPQANEQVKMKLNSFCVKNFNEDSNKKAMVENLDLLEERRDTTRVRLVVYQLRAAQYNNLRVCMQAFKTRDLVLRKVLLNTRDPGARVLGAN